MRPLLTDVRIAFRSLRKQPVLATAAGLTLALGIGANTAIFSVVWGAWLKPLPYPDADRLVRISDRHQSFEPGVYSTVSFGDYVDLKEGNRTLESTTLFTFGVMTVARDSTRIPVLYTEPTLFETLGATPTVGRAFSPEDVGTETWGVILSHGFWTEWFGASRDVLGEHLVLNGNPYVVVGVAPESFEMPRDVEAIIPFQWSEQQRTSHTGRSMNAIGRLRPGVTIEAARADLQAIYAGIAEEYPESHEGWTSWVSSFREYVVGSDHTVLKLMSTAAVLLLLVTCVNVTSLLLARAESRRREVAVRMALGAGRTRVFTSFLGEGLVVGVLGGLLGVGVAYGGIGLLVAIFGDGLQRVSAIGLNETTLAVALGLTLLVSLGVGLIPGLRLDMDRLSDRLRSGGRGGTRDGLALRTGLVVTEIVLAVVLVCGAGLLANTMWRLTNAELGAEPDDAMVVYLEPPEGRYAEQTEKAAFYRDLLEALGRQPGIAAVGAGDRDPFDVSITTNGIMAEGRPESATDFVILRQVTPGYFPATGIELVVGELFGWLPPHDPEADADVPVVINQALADALFPGGDALGQSVGDEDGWHRVVGVVESVRQRGAAEPPRPALFFPWPAVPVSYGSRPSLFLRAAGGPAAESEALTALRSTLEQIDADVRFTNRPLSEGLGRLYGEHEFALSLMSLFAGLALLLGAVGIYGMVSYTVAQRTRELGIRIALGAKREQVVGMVIRQGMAVTVPGVVLGLSAAAWLGRYLSGVLYEVSPVDGITYLAVTSVFSITAVAACLVPARRATTVEPTTALRSE